MRCQVTTASGMWSLGVILYVLSGYPPFHAKSNQEKQQRILACRCSSGDNATLSEFEEVLRAIKMNLLVPLAPRVFDLFDNNRDGTVDMREILCGLSGLKNSQGDDALQLCFQMYDADRSGCISKEELASMLRAFPDDCLPGDIT